MRTYLIMTALALTISSCGETKKEEKTALKIGQNNTESVTPSGTALALSGNDMMQFDKSELMAQAGEKITLTFRHVGQLDRRVMGHNFVLLTPGTDITGFANEAAAAGESADWIPNDGAQVIAHTKMLGGGQTDVITFEAPEPGVYDFICSFPGHSGMMRGTLTVAPKS
ncbi:MAG: azurin [Bacteroidetes bacterium]|jgi:azurin|nr:azurin [Bacteroidota bacterium]MDA1210485.1 azurin [Bacteroidota bacterium]